MFGMPGDPISMAYVMWKIAPKEAKVIMTVATLVFAGFIGVSVWYASKNPGPTEQEVQHAIPVGGSIYPYTWAGLQGNELVFSRTTSGLFSSSTRYVKSPYTQDMSFDLDGTKMTSVMVWNDGSLHYKSIEVVY